MESDLEEIKKQYPSICYGCDLSRKAASDENTKNGYVGCCIRVLDRVKIGDEYFIDAEEVAEGWVDLKCFPKLGKGSGMITNFQILTLKTTKCPNYINKRK